MYDCCHVVAFLEIVSSSIDGKPLRMKWFQMVSSSGRYSHHRMVVMIRTGYTYLKNTKRISTVGKDMCLHACAYMDILVNI